MSIKSWFVFLVKKMDEKSAKRTIQHFKKLNICSIRLDEDMRLFYVTDKGTTERDWLSAKLKEQQKKCLYDNMIEEFDELFGAHQELTEDGKVSLVWYIQ